MAPTVADTAVSAISMPLHHSKKAKADIHQCLFLKMHIVILVDMFIRTACKSYADFELNTLIPTTTYLGIAKHNDVLVGSETN